jgi:hypothetical protein
MNGSNAGLAKELAADDVCNKLVKLMKNISPPARNNEPLRVDPTKVYIIHEWPPSVTLGEHTNPSTFYKGHYQEAGSCIL